MYAVRADACHSLCAVVVQTFLTAHELSLCLHSSSAVFDKCQKLSTPDSVDNYSLITGAFYQLLNSMLVHRTETVFHLVPAFTGAAKRIL